MLIGKRLLVAAEVVEKTGKQVDIMLDCLQNQLIESLDEHGIVAELNDNLDDILRDNNEWIIKSYVKNIALYKTRRHKKPYGYIALQTTIYSEEEMSQVDNWEPLLYIAYSPENLGAGPFDYSRCTISSQDNKLCFYPSDDSSADNLDCWFFAIPLSEVTNENVLDECIVTPACKLLKLDFKDVVSSKIVQAHDLPFSFKMENDRISLSR